MLYLESYQARFNNGKGMSVADFRAHFNIPEDVKVIAVDANGNTKNGGHEKNFNVKNTKVGTYGIAPRSDALEAACNVVDGACVDGNYRESEHLICWATMDFTDMLLDGSPANATYNYTWDFGGYGAIDQAYTYHRNEDYVYDARRCFLVTMYDEPTAGRLNPVQKMTLGVGLAEGESFTFDSLIMYYPLLDDKIESFKIGDKFYDDNETFTAPYAGVYTFDYFFEGEGETKAPTEAPTETPDNGTEAPTNAPEAPTEAPKGGCGSALGPAMIPFLAMGVILVAKKRED